MPDLSIALPSGALEEAFLRIVDPEGKLPAALEALGPVVDRDVVVLDCGHGFRARQLAEMGARVAAFEFPLCDAASEGLAGWVGRADAVVVPWSEMAAPGSRFLAEAGALLRPGGRLLVIHDYGRDDVWGLLPEFRERDVAWSQRRGPFLGDGFRIRVIHCWWAFESIEQARELLGTVFGPAGVEAAERMRRLRLEYSIAIYHRSAPGGEAGRGEAGEAGEVGEPGPIPRWPMPPRDRCRRRCGRAGTLFGTMTGDGVTTGGSPRAPGPGETEEFDAGPSAAPSAAPSRRAPSAAPGAAPSAGQPEPNDWLAPAAPACACGGGCARGGDCARGAAAPAAAAAPVAAPGEPPASLADDDARRRDARR